MILKKYKKIEEKKDGNLRERRKMTEEGDSSAKISLASSLRRRRKIPSTPMWYTKAEKGTLLGQKGGGEAILN